LNPEPPILHPFNSLVEPGISLQAFPPHQHALHVYEIPQNQVSKQMTCCMLGDRIQLAEPFPFQLAALSDYSGVRIHQVAVRVSLQHLELHLQLIRFPYVIGITETNKISPGSAQPIVPRLGRPSIDGVADWADTSVSFREPAYFAPGIIRGAIVYDQQLQI
jgi:hypothetical protein